MNATVRALLDTFDDLPDAEQYQVTIEILRRATRSSTEEIPDEGLIAAADEVFRELDVSEATDASFPSR
jgi:hypothetical protein